MIIDGLISIVVHFVAPVFNDFLPHLALGTIPVVGATYMEQLGHDFRFMTPVFPASLLVAWLTVWAVLFVGRAGYIVFNWVLTHLPAFAGFKV